MAFYPLLKKPVNQEEEAKTSFNQLHFYKANIVAVLSGFITQFCKDKAPLQFAISRIFLQPLNK